MKYLFLSLLIIFVSTTCIAQIMDTCKLSPLPSNTVFIEFAGNAAFFGSLNYERNILNIKSFFLTGRVGIGYGRVFEYSMLSMPIIINGVFRVFRTISYEIGVGISLMRIGNLNSQSGSGWSYNNDIAPTAIIGLRVQSKNGFLFRFNFTPIYTNFNNTETRNNLYPFFGISFGYGFGGKE
jgi:hypothetical protein